MNIPMMPLPGGEKTILISKQAFADKCSVVAAQFAMFEEREYGKDPMEVIKLCSKLLAGITSYLFDDDEEDGESDNGGKSGVAEEPAE